jgi:hypothetical protein
MRTFSQLAHRAAAHFIPRFADPVRCGGCGRDKADAPRLVAGPRVYLCSDCFAQAARQLAPQRPPVDAVRCRFCCLLRAPVAVTGIGAVVVCADCLGMMDVVLAEATKASVDTKSSG